MIVLQNDSNHCVALELSSVKGADKLMDQALSFGAYPGWMEIMIDEEIGVFGSLSCRAKIQISVAPQ